MNNTETIIYLLKRLKKYFSLLGTWILENSLYYFTTPESTLKAEIVDTCVALFDGIDDYVAPTNLISWNIGIRVDLWVNLWSVSTTAYLIGDSSNGFRYNGTNFLMFAGGLSLRTVDYTKTNEIIKLSVLRINSTDYEIYINDILLGVSGTELNNTLFIRTIGKRNDGYFFNGYLGRFRVLNGASSLLDYVFNHQNGSVVYDISSNNNHGSIFNHTSSIFWIKQKFNPLNITQGCTMYQNGSLYLFIVGNNNYAISGYTRIGFFATPFLLLKGLFNSIVIPADAKLNKYLPAGTYNFDNLNGLVPSKNLIINKTENSIISLIVKT